MNLIKPVTDLKHHTSTFALNASLFVQQLSNFKVDIAITVSRNTTESK